MHIDSMQYGEILPHFFFLVLSLRTRSMKIRKYYFFRSLKACAHSFLRNPGMHHSMHNGSIALALCTLPISSTSNPNFSSIPRTFFFASSLFPHMNMVGFVWSPKSGLTMNADPM